MSSEEADPRFELIFAEARRGLDRQATRLNEIHARVSALLGAASISAAFLAGTALDNHARFRGWTWVGTGAFVLVALLSAWVLFPVPGWRFVLDANWMLEKYIDSDDPKNIDAMRRDLAKWSERYYKKNDRKLKWRTWALSAVCVLLAIEIVAFVLDLRGRR